MEPVVQSKRKGIVHFEQLKDLEFLDFLDEIKDSSNRFVLKNIPITLKVDGFGCRFGRDSSDRPFFETSRSGPKYDSGEFYKFNVNKGITDPVVLGRAKEFDKLQTEIISLINRIDPSNFLHDAKVHVEALYLPFAEEQADGRLKFVGIAYDALPPGIKLVMVPLFVEKSSTGEPHPFSNKIIKKLLALKKVGNAMFVSNELTQVADIDVTGYLPPLSNLDELRSMLMSGKRALKATAKEILVPFKQAVADAIIADPNILGKDILGKEYEGIVLQSKNGFIKITSQEQKNIMKNKRMIGESETSGRTAVVTIGSFVGHVGHEFLVKHVLARARELDADPYVYISSKVGKDDPVPPELKLQTWKKLFPSNASMFSLIQEGGSPVKKIEKELVTVSNPPPYDKIIVIVGDDRYEGFKKWMEHLGKRMKNPKFPGFEHVEFDVECVGRSSESGSNGMSFTSLRNVLADSELTDDDKLEIWCTGFNEKKLGRSWINKLMQVSKENMGLNEVNESVKNNPIDVVTFDIPLLIRMLEYAREDAKTDMDLHNIVSKLIDMSSDGKTLSMEDYEKIVSPKLDEAIAIYERIEKFEAQMSKLKILTESLTK
jgi:hypothetical protein